MKKLAKIFLCLSLALMMSLSLMVPAFAAGTCNHSFKRVIVGTYVWYDNITSMGHQWNKGDLLQCSKCGAKVGVAHFRVDIMSGQNIAVTTPQAIQPSICM